MKTVYQPRNSTTAPSYTVVDIKTNNPLSKRYYNNDLLLVTNVDNKIEKVKNIYEISKLIEPVLLNNKKAYIVAWKGYRKTSDRTIEKRDYLIEDVPKLIHEYERSNNIDWKNVDKYKK